MQNIQNGEIDKLHDQMEEYLCEARLELRMKSAGLWETPAVATRKQNTQAITKMMCIANSRKKSGFDNNQKIAWHIPYWAIIFSEATDGTNDGWYIRGIINTTGNHMWRTLQLRKRRLYAFDSY